MSKKRVLVLSAHTDDAEIGAGGTINKWVRKGHNVMAIAFSNCVDSLPEGYDENTLIDENLRAMNTLGVYNISVVPFEARSFPSQRQAILDKMIKIGNIFEPEIVLCPSLNDAHQDHQVIAQEAIRAFRRTATILHYEMPWNHLTFSNTVYVPLDEVDVESKVKSIQCYESQLVKPKPHYKTLIKTIENLAQVRGSQINQEFAEVFEVTRMIL